MSYYSVCTFISGQTYKLRVWGGNHPKIVSLNNYLYLTSNSTHEHPEGGTDRLTDEENQWTRTFENGTIAKIKPGPLCTVSVDK